MRIAIALVLVAACGGAPASKPVAVLNVPDAAPLELAWLEGAWHGASMDTRWISSSGVVWGVTLHGLGFEVSRLRQNDGAYELLKLPEGKYPTTLKVAASGHDRIDFGDSDHLRLARHDDTLRYEFQHGDADPQAFELSRVPAIHIPALEDVDRTFAADSAKLGVEGWMKHFAPGAALWHGKRIEGDAELRAEIAKSLEGGALTWEPKASGVRGDFGFTIGTFQFVPTGAVAQAMIGTYCTIWRQVEGSWEVLFDIGG